MGFDRLHGSRQNDLALFLRQHSCLTLNIYHEARGEPIAGQFAVAHVTLNRANHNWRRLCKVIYQPHQFSWTSNPFLLSDKNSTSWMIAERVSAVVMLFPKWDITKGAQYYHAVYVSPSWAIRLKRTKQIDNHIFYRRKSN